MAKQDPGKQSKAQTQATPKKAKETVVQASKKYEITGSIAGAKQFRKVVSGRSERHAKDVALSLFGSCGGFKRSQIKITGIKAVE